MILDTSLIIEIFIVIIFIIASIFKPLKVYKWLASFSFLVLIMDFIYKIKSINMALQMHNYVEIACASICSLFFLIKPAYCNKRFVFFLWATVIVELSAFFMHDQPKQRFVMYNFFNGVEFLFYFIFISGVFQNVGNRNVAKIFLIIFTVFFIANITSFQGLNIYNSYTHTIGAILLVILIIITFYEFITLEDRKFVFNQKAVIAILAGVFIYYSTVTGMIAGVAIVSKIDIQRALMLFHKVSQPCNFLLYGLISFGIIRETNLGILKRLKINTDDQ